MFAFYIYIITHTTNYILFKVFEVRREQRQAQAVVADQAQTIKSLQIINNRLNDRVVELSKLRRSVSDKYKDMELQIKKLSLENASLKDEICRLVVQVRSLQRM